MATLKRIIGWQRAAVQGAYDAVCWTIALFFGTVSRYDLHTASVNFGRLLLALPIVVLAHLIVGPLFGLYRRRWPFGGLDELTALIRTTFIATAILFVVNLLPRARLVPRVAPLIAGVTSLLLTGAGRYVWRLRHERRLRPNADGALRLLVFGAGEGGYQIVRAMMRNPESDFIPVALLDDDPDKRNLRIMGVRVVGGLDAMSSAAATHHADALLIAIPSAGASLVTEASDIAASCGLPVKVLPPVSELLGGRVGEGDIRDVSPADLLGRHEIRTDVAGIAGYLTGKRLLVTGAGGSIGSELCRQIYRFAPAELIMLDRDESALHAVHLSIYGRALMESPDLVLADLRDPDAIDKVIATRQPDVIFHAAALKHLPLLERFPGEAVKTNVLATLDLLECALRHGVKRFVNVSTDKAAEPCSVLGYTKRITERVTSFMSSRGSTLCLSVRFGNVLGSRGSVLETFQAQIDRGGPLTVTDPDATRYFMTVEEAVELIIQAGAIGRPGEVLVLDMGEPVRITEVAQVLAARSERPVAIHFTGLRRGEKLHEALLGPNEIDARPFHPLISQSAVPPLDPYVVRSVIDLAGEDELAARLAALCTATPDVVTED